MNAIRIHRKLDSETLHLPELRPLIGREVEIIVLDERAPNVQFTPGTGDWDAALRAVKELIANDGFDFEAVRLQNECDWKHAEDHLP